MHSDDDDKRILIGVLSKIAKGLPKQARRDFRALLADEAPKPKRRKVHSWRKGKSKSAGRSVPKKPPAKIKRPKPQMDMDL